MYNMPRIQTILFYAGGGGGDNSPRMRQEAGFVVS